MGLDYNREEALERMGRDDELLNEIVKLFLEDAHAEITELKATLEAGDTESAADLAHSLKGASANIGAENFRDQAREIELLCKSGDGDGALKSIEKLGELYSLVVKAVGTR